MKKGIKIIMALTIGALSSCSENDVDKPVVKEFIKDYGCVEPIYDKISRHLVSQTDLLSIQDLFSKNNLSFENLKFTRFDNLDGSRIHIFASQFANELPIFFSSVGFHFSNGSLYLTLPDRYEKTSADLDTLRIFESSIVRGLYMSEIRNHKIKEDNYKNDCLEVEFGYVDVNALKSISPRGNFKKAWYVHPKSQPFPEALFIDGEGTTLYFFDGIITGG